MSLTQTGCRKFLRHTANDPSREVDLLTWLGASIQRLHDPEQSMVYSSQCFEAAESTPKAAQGVQFQIWIHSNSISNSQTTQQLPNKHSSKLKLNLTQATQYQ